MRLDCGLCVIREWSLADKPALLRYANNADIARHLTRMPHPYTEAHADEFLAQHCGDEAVPGWAIDVEGVVVGGIGITLREGVLVKNALLGYWLAEPFWGRGIMSAAVHGVVNYSLDKFDLNRLEAHVFEENPASMRVLQKCGFVREGLLRNNVFKDGRLISTVLYALVKL
ncbi:MAG: GNAT family protein [Steroidobacteraceae bacterium]